MRATVGPTTLQRVPKRHDELDMSSLRRDESVVGR